MSAAHDQLLLVIIAPDKRDPQCIGGGDGPVSFLIAMQGMQAERWMPLVGVKQFQGMGEAPTIRR